MANAHFDWWTLNLQGPDRSVSLESDPPSGVVAESEGAKVLEPGGSPPHPHLQLLTLTEDQARCFRQLPKIKLPNGCWVHRVQSTLPILGGSLVCSFDTWPRAVTWMQAMLEDVSL